MENIGLIDGKAKEKNNININNNDNKTVENVGKELQRTLCEHNEDVLDKVMTRRQSQYTKENVWKFTHCQQCNTDKSATQRRKKKIYV